MSFTTYLFPVFFWVLKPRYLFEALGWDWVLRFEIDTIYYTPQLYEISVWQCKSWLWSWTKWTNHRHAERMRRGAVWIGAPKLRTSSTCCTRRGCAHLCFHGSPLSVITSPFCGWNPLPFAWSLALLSRNMCW